MVRLGTTPVLDFGSFSVKAGFVGEQYPLLVYNHETFEKTWPIVRGEVEDWATFEELVRFIWTKLRVDPTEEEVILIECPSTTEEDHSRMESLMFEQFKVRYLTFLSAPLCVCYAAGIKTGLVVDFGHGSTRITVMVESKAMKQIVIPVGGMDVDRSLEERLKVQYPEEQLTNHVRLIKERHCYATLEPRTLERQAYDKSRHSPRSYALPDGTSLHISEDAAALCLEVLFRFQYGKGTLATVIKELLNMYPEYADVLSANIVIVGATTQSTNFNYRLLSELYASKAAHVLRVVCPPDREFTCWVGASVIYFDSEYEDMGMSFSEYTAASSPTSL